MKYDVYGRLTDFAYLDGTGYTAATKTAGLVTPATYYSCSLTEAASPDADMARILGAASRAATACQKLSVC